jgi:hypothetical protein
MPAERGRELSPSSAPAKTFRAVGSNGQGSTSKTISRDMANAAHEISPLENASSQMEADAPNFTRILESALGMIRSEKGAKAALAPSAHPGDSLAVSAAKVIRTSPRPSARPKFVSVKTRLLDLWHQILNKDEESRSWAAVVNSRKVDRKKVSYAAETNH